MNIDPYIDPKTGILKNRLGIRDAGALLKAEADITSVNILRLRTESTRLPVTFTPLHWRKMHKEIFKEVYPWAGEFRSVAISKSGHLFALPHCILPQAQKLLHQMKEQNYFKGLSRDEYAEKMGYYLSECNVVHPFREGNGRTQRMLFSQIARKNNVQIDWKLATKQEMTTASLAAFDLQYEPMAKLINQCITDFPRNQKQALGRSRTL